MNKQQYSKMVKELSPSSPLLTDMLKAFVAGGAVCVLGELLLNFYMTMNLSEISASTFVSITLIFLAQLFTGFGLYEKAAKHIGAGLSVPISGFANAVVSPAIEYHTEGLILGLGAKLFTISGPVIVYGTVASFVAGIFYYIKELIF